MEENNSTFSKLTLGCQDNPEKGDATWQNTSILAFFYRNRALHCLEIHYVSCELFASHIFDNIISNLYFSPQTFLCSLVLIDSSEKIETI